MQLHGQKRSILGGTAVGVISSLMYLHGCEAFHVAPFAAKNAWTLYKNLLVANPILTKSLTSSCVMTLSDFMCQGLLLKSKASSTDRQGHPSPSGDDSGLDYTRILHAAITGALWSGPVTHYWYATLEKMYGTIARLFHIQDPAIALVVKVFLDGIIFSPFTIMGYFTVRSILEGSGLKGAKEKLASRFKSTLVGAWRFWPLANAFNFWYVPYQFRVLYMNVLALFWTGYLTYVNSKKVIVVAAPNKYP